MSIIFTFHTFYSTHSNCYNNANTMIRMEYFSMIMVECFSITIYRWAESPSGMLLFL